MYYYIESDGRIFLVEREGLLDLPRKPEIPFSIEEVAFLSMDTPALFCVPQLERHPRDWPAKDEIPKRSNVSRRVREAVQASMPRVLVEGIAVRDRRVLLVKGSRGLMKGRWSLPGGFLRFGEAPVEGLRREIREELRADAHVRELLDVKATLGEESRLHWIMFFYRVEIEGELRPDPDEIEAAEYIPFEKVDALLHDDLMREAVAAAATALREDRH